VDEIQVEFAETIKKYRFPLEQIAEMTYPTYLRQAIQKYA
jgi:hypothetical protein